MIDTIVIRIHDLEAHETLCKYLNRKTGEGASVYSVESDKDYTERQKRIYKTLLVYQDTGKMIEKAHFNKLKSSHYNIAYHIDYDRNFISLNLSIPKYLYGTNVVQFTRSPFIPGFHFGHHSELKTNIEEAFPRLMQFIKRFFKVEFTGITIYPKLVEINRIDICFNQVFDTKQSALEYLKQLQTIKKKYSRDASNFSRDWKTTIMYRTDKYSFKVYHKGSEFKKHDKKELGKFNESPEALKKGKFNLEFYQEFSDKMLRYELTVRGSYMSYLYMRHIFRSDCHLWQYGFKLYEKQRAAKDKKPSLISPDPYQAFRKSLTVDDQKHIAYVKHHISKTKKFYLNVTEEEKDFDLETDHSSFITFPSKKERFSYSSKFTPELFRHLTDKFLGLLKEFELATFKDNSMVLSKLDQYNNEAKTKKQLFTDIGIPSNLKPRVISRSKIVLILEMLQTHTFEEIQESKVFSRATWYRYKKDLEMLGLTDKNLISISYNAPFNFRNYYNTVMHNKFIFRNLEVV